MPSNIIRDKQLSTVQPPQDNWPKTKNDVIQITTYKPSISQHIPIENSPETVLPITTMRPKTPFRPINIWSTIENNSPRGTTKLFSEGGRTSTEEYIQTTTESANQRPTSTSTIQINKSSISTKKVTKPESTTFTESTSIFTTSEYFDWPTTKYNNIFIKNNITTNTESPLQIDSTKFTPTSSSTTIDNWSPTTAKQKISSNTTPNIRPNTFATEFVYNSFVTEKDVSPIQVEKHLATRKPPRDNWPKTEVDIIQITTFRPLTKSPDLIHVPTDSNIPITTSNNPSEHPLTVPKSPENPVTTAQPNNWLTTSSIRNNWSTTSRSIINKEINTLKNVIFTTTPDILSFFTPVTSPKTYTTTERSSTVPETATSKTILTHLIEYECTSSLECRRNEACVKNKCLNPCHLTSPCDSGFLCIARNNLALCQCPTGSVIGSHCPKGKQSSISIFI